MRIVCFKTQAIVIVILGGEGHEYGSVQDGREDTEGAVMDLDPEVRLTMHLPNHGMRSTLT